MFAWRLLIREFKTGDVLTLLLALVLSVATVTGIGLFVDRLQQSFEVQSANLLGADRSVRRDDPIPQDWLQQAQNTGLETAQTASFSSMVFGGDGLQLAQVTAVSNNYPLRGEFITDQQLFGAGQATNQAPERGEIWLSSRLASLLSVELGQSVRVGEAPLTVTQFLVRDPGSATSAFSIAPRAIMNAQDLPATQVIIPGARVRYAFLYAGDAERLARFDQALTPQLGEGERIRTPIERGERIGNTVNRAESFLLLAGTLAVVMSGVAMALASARYVKRHLTQFAVMKTMGATPKRLVRLMVFQVTLITLLGIVLGSGLGLLIQSLIADLLASLMSSRLPEPSLSKLWLGAATAVISILAFCAPLLARLVNVPPLRVLQPNAGLQVSSSSLFTFGLVGMYGLMVIYAGGWRLPSTVMFGLAVVTGLVFLVGWGLFAVSRRLSKQSTTGWQVGLAALHRRLVSNLFQLLVFTLIIMLSLVLVGVQSNLIRDWQAQIPEDTPNHYLFNVQERQVDSIQAYTMDNQIVSSDWFPMVRGRVIAINGEDAEVLFPDRRNEPEIVERELNLTWADDIGSGSTVIEGDFSAEGVSIEQEAAIEAGVAIGDELTISIGGLDYTLPITSIRTVDWQSMQPNFYLILPQSVLSDYQANYVSSVFLKEDNAAQFYRFMANYPTVSMLNIGELLRQVQDIIAQLANALKIVLAFILGAGALVLIASVRSTLDERLEEGALLRTLGATKKIVRQALLIEFGALGLFAGLIGAAGAELALVGLQHFVFEMAVTIHPLLWLVGPLAGWGIVTIIGVFASRAVLKVPPIRLLRSI
ncbi:FtsX-like permease family protein [Marinomonas aquimarina]|uniref:FtsX-like permease family protein n=1 Tax=Marinomonas aquimarina TaxID=295068 RepID=A0A1A8TEJ1_9GAMM|nr:FtsX-like permease family protein [Marinomonas aquimarina]SBS31709.1 FtsX-like permease family protein [Marinomonas aquimarina]